MFDHELEGEVLAKLEKELDPTLPRNQKWIRWCEKSWERSQLMARLNIWGQLVFALLGVASTLILNEVLLAVGIQNFWIRGIVCVLVFSGSLQGFFWLLGFGYGWFRWLFR